MLELHLGTDLVGVAVSNNQSIVTQKNFSFSAMACTCLLITLSGCGGGGGGGSSGGNSGGRPPPTVSLTTSAPEVAVNGSVTLTWSSTNATSCTASGAWSGSKSTSGSQSVTVAQNSTYTVSCSGSGGQAAADVAVTAWAPPTVTLAAADIEMLTGNVTTLTWSSTQAKSCQGIAGLSGTLSTSGSQDSGTLTNSSTFTVECGNGFQPAARASVTVNISTTYSLTVQAFYERPGAAVTGSGGSKVPDWANPIVGPVPYVYMELRGPGGAVVGAGYADGEGRKTFTGLSPTQEYSPALRSKARGPDGFDLWVVDNRSPVSNSASTLRARYQPYGGLAPPYQANQRDVQQAYGITAPLGWDAEQGTLPATQRFSGPYAIIADLMRTDNVFKSAGAEFSINRLTVLWTPWNKGGRTDFRKNYDEGTVDGSGGYYVKNGCLANIDLAGFFSCLSGSEPHIFLSGDTAFELMEFGGTVSIHEAGHFAQDQASRSWTPGGSHSFSEYQDPSIVWNEGFATGLVTLVNTNPVVERIFTFSGQLISSPDDFSRAATYSSPRGWFQERTVARLLWSLRDPSGSIGLSPSQIFSPMFSSEWIGGRFAPNVWAFGVLLKSEQPSSSGAIDALGSNLGITLAGNDVWGSNEMVLGNRTQAQTFPIYTTVPLSGSVQVCATGAANEYNKLGNRRYLRLKGDETSHRYTVSGPPGTVPFLVIEGSNFLVAPGQNSFVWSGPLPQGDTWAFIGNCSTILSEDPSSTTVCNSGTPPAEQCFTVNVSPN